MQTLLVTILFLASAIYLGRLVYQNFKGKTHCASGCNSCSAPSLDKIEKKIEHSAP